MKDGYTTRDIKPKRERKAYTTRSVVETTAVSCPHCGAPDAVRFDGGSHVNARGQRVRYGRCKVCGSGVINIEK